VAEDQQAGESLRVGPFRLGRVLGTGGMGRVYLGWSPGGRAVAIKIINRELAADQELRERFRREVAAAKRVNSHYTVQVIDADVDGPQPWVATAYVDAPSLDRAVRADGPLTAESVRALAAGLAEGLAAIHAAGLVHRDLKPANILLAADGPRIIDFGIVRSAEVRLTGEGAIMGTPAYMSPEQVTGSPGVGPSSDVFGLGAVLVFAATGEGPFGDGSMTALLYRLLQEPPRLEGVPDELRPVIESTLAKDPNDRPTVQELLARLVQSGPRPFPDWHPRLVSSEGAQEDSAEGELPPGPSGPTADPPEGEQEAAARIGGQEAPGPLRSSPRLPGRLAARALRWVAPPAAIAVLRSDHQALRDEALQFVEAEIDRAYFALGLPPGLEGPDSEGRLDVERD
jgi:eukaryotic-like serine/threonine-protein kinase